MHTSAGRNTAAPPGLLPREREAEQGSRGLEIHSFALMFLATSAGMRTIWNLCVRNVQHDNNPGEVRGERVCREQVRLHVTLESPLTECET